MNLTELAVRRPITTAMLLVSVVVLGLISAARLPLAFLPTLDLPFVVVIVPYPNSNPTQVEKTIARPLEEVFATLPDLKKLRSRSSADQCEMQMEFSWGLELDVIRMLMREKLVQARPGLPRDIGEIQVYSINTTDIPIVQARGGVSMRACAIGCPRPESVLRSSIDSKPSARSGISPISRAPISSPPGRPSRSSGCVSTLDRMGLGGFLDLDLTIVRGLAYYTGTVFELFDAGYSLRAICGGGRYDALLQAMGGVDLPALGFGMGDVVLGELLRERGLLPPEDPPVEVFLAAVTAEDHGHLLGLAHRLRDAGIRVEYPLAEAAVGKQLKLASSRAARPYIVHFSPLTSLPI